MVFPGENVSCGPWKLKRLAAVRGKLAVNGGKVISGDAEWQDHLATRGTKGTKCRSQILCFCASCGLICVHGWGVGMGHKTATTPRFVLVRSTNRNPLFGFERALGVIGRLATLHADCVRFGDVLSNRE